MNKFTQKRLRPNIGILLSFLFALLCGTQTAYALTVLDSDLNSNGIVDSTETEIIVTSNKSLPAGEYNFNNLTVTNNTTLTLVGDPLSVGTFKGVKINATNIAVSSGSRISADGQGYQFGPGTSLVPSVSAGASYGGTGGGNISTSTYGSAMMPMDLGSGTSGYKGGGAIRLVVTSTLLNNGDISANGQLYRTSGGSIYVTTNILTGTGTFNANGSGTYWPYYFAGGGGRIAVHYEQSSFTGNAKALAGIYCFYGCNPGGGAGTVVFLDSINNDLYPIGFFKFQTRDAPFNLHNISPSGNTYIETENGISITAENISLQNASQLAIADGVVIKSNNLSISQNSSATLNGASVLSVPYITIGQGSTLSLSGNETLTADTLTIQNGGTLTVAKEHVLSLTIPNLNISTGGSISVNAKGYGAGLGQGAPVTPLAGASYGGVGFYNSATSTYGSSTAPIDFGSGGNGYFPNGGGAIKLIVTDTLFNNGTVSADGSNTSSGGSIYVTANTMSGSGSYRANGGGFYCPNVCFGMGGGGRVAIYYATSTFTGITLAKGGCNSFDGWTMTCGGSGTVVVKQIENGCQTNCFSNVLFLPGLEASRLYRADVNGAEDQLWEPNTDEDAMELFLTTDGRSIRSDVYTKDVIDEAYLGGPNIYKSFLDEMKTLESLYGITATTTPYDWRLSLEDIINNGIKAGENISYLNATSSPNIIKELRRLAQISKTGKVTIVAHSNGGLVAKALMQKLGDTETSKLIDKVIFVAVPQTGTPEAIGALLHGYEQGLPKDWLHFFLSPKVARSFAENMPSAYNLLPSANYLNSVSTPVVTFEDKPVLAEFRVRYGAEIASATGLKNFITDTWRIASSTPSDLTYPSVGNGTLLARAETTHATLDNWTPPQGVSLYEIAGWGEDTLATIEYREGRKSICKEVPPLFPFTQAHCVYTLVPTITYYPKEVIDGDGTVVTPSALWTATATTTGKWWVDLREYDTFFNYEREHADILEVPELRTFIQNILTNTTLTLPRYIYTTEPIPKITDTRLSFLLHSPLNLSATDNLGNVISSATSTILGASFRRYGEVQILRVPKGTPVTLNLEGYASGSFTLDMEELDGLNTVVASTTFSAVPSATSTIATISFPDGTLQNATPLLVDYDNNGITDFTLHPIIGKEVVFDTTPPEAHISFSTTTQQLLIEGFDEAGGTTIQTTSTSTIITDESSNTLEISFNKLGQEKHELKLEIQALSYNGISTSTIPKTTVQYEWSTDNVGGIKELEQKVGIGSLKIEAHYDAKKNITKIDRKLKEEESDGNNEIKKILPGFRILKLITDKGVVRVDY